MMLIRKGSRQDEKAVIPAQARISRQTC